MATYTDALFMKPDDNALLAYIESNYDQLQLMQLIIDTQQYRIKPIIGSGLYDELVTQITAGTLTALNTTLIGNIRPVLRWFVLADGVEIFTYKIRNKGVHTQNSDNGTPVDQTVLIRLMRKYEDYAQEYAKRLANYLLQNNSSFPLYLNPGNTIDTIFPSGDQHHTGWYLGGDDHDLWWLKYH